MDNEPNFKSPWTDLPAEAPVLPVSRAAALLGIGVSTYYSWVAQGIAPPPIKLTASGRASRIPKNHLDAFIRSRFDLSNCPEQ